MKLLEWLDMAIGEVFKLNGKNLSIYPFIQAPFHDFYRSHKGFPTFTRLDNFLKRSMIGNTLSEGWPQRLHSFWVLCIKIYASHAFTSYLIKVMNKYERETTQTVKKLAHTTCLWV
jgi:hypothetical protein